MFGGDDFPPAPFSMDQKSMGVGAENRDRSQYSQAPMASPESGVFGDEPPPQRRRRPDRVLTAAGELAPRGLTSQIPRSHRLPACVSSNRTISSVVFRKINSTFQPPPPYDSYPRHRPGSRVRRAPALKKKPCLHARGQTMNRR